MSILDSILSRIKTPNGRALPLLRFTAYYDQNTQKYLSDLEALQLGLNVGWEDFRKEPCDHQHASRGFCIACGQDLRGA